MIIVTQQLQSERVVDVVWVWWLPLGYSGIELVVARSVEVAGGGVETAVDDQLAAAGSAAEKGQIAGITKVFRAAVWARY